MISNFRKGADNIFVRILLGILALSFVGIGGAAFISGNSVGEIVTFSKTDSILYEQFKYEKAKEIDSLQKKDNKSLTDENIVELNLDEKILNRLISISMINYLSKFYEIDISNDQVISHIKKTPYFNDSNDKFDFNIFRSTFKNSVKKEEEYLSSFKQNLISSVILNVFLDSFVPPKIMIDNIINYQTETRVTDILSIDLEQGAKDYKAEIVNIDDAEEFYAKNKAMFVQSDQRSFEYIKADKNFILSKLNIADKDLKTYFDDNWDEFSTKNFDDVKIQIKEIFVKEKTDELISDLSKKFEEDVVSGLTIAEIAKKYNLEIFTVNDITLSKMNSNDNIDYMAMADTIFDMAKNELSYPIEVHDSSEILLVAVTDIKPQRDLAFEEVKNDIIKLIEKRNLALHNVQILEDVKKSYNINNNQIIHPSVKKIVNKSLSRTNRALENKLPMSLLKEIFNINLYESTTLSGDGKNAYFAYVKEIKGNIPLAKKIHENSNDYFKVFIKEGILQELINHMKIENNIKINYITE